MYVVFEAVGVEAAGSDRQLLELVIIITVGVTVAGTVAVVGKVV